MRIPFHVKYPFIPIIVRYFVTPSHGQAFDSCGLACSLLSHKRHYCKLRFTCKCEDDQLEQLDDIPGVLQCSSCGQDFSDPWDLMEHVQDVHTLNIYQLCDDNQNVATLQ